MIGSGGDLLELAFDLDLTREKVVGREVGGWEVGREVGR